MDLPRRFLKHRIVATGKLFEVGTLSSPTLDGLADQKVSSN